MKVQRTKKTGKKNKPSGDNGRKAVRVLWSIFGIGIVLVVLFFICVAKGVFGTMPTFEDWKIPKPTWPRKSSRATARYWAAIMWRTAPTCVTATFRLTCPRPW